MSTTVFLTVDEWLVRDSLRALLQRQPDVRVIGGAVNGWEAVNKIAACRPDVALLDLIMPELNGIEATRRIHQICPATHVIIFSLYADKGHISEAIRAGAYGYILKGADGSEIIQAIRLVHSGQRYLSQKIVSMVQKGYLSLPEWVKDETAPVYVNSLKRPQFRGDWLISNELALLQKTRQRAREQRQAMQEIRQKAFGTRLKSVALQEKVRKTFQRAVTLCEKRQLRWEVC